MPARAQDYPTRADPPRGRLPGRRADRFRRAPARRQAQGHSRPERADREQVRRQRGDRRRLRREVRARRLHAVLHHHQRRGDEPASARRPALRSGARFRAGDAGRAHHGSAGGEREIADQVGEGAGRSREGKERRPADGLDRRRQPAASRARTVPAVGRRQGRARALSRRRARRHRHARRTGRSAPFSTCRW